MRYAARVLLFALYVVLPASAQEAPAPAAAVTYVSGSSVYVSAGSEEGLKLGDRIEVVRDGTVVAVVEVAYLSPHKASCSIVESSAAPRPGDAIRFQPSSPAPAPAEIPAAAPVKEPVRRRRDRPVKGRIGVRYLAVNDRVADASDYKQPSLDLRLSGSRLGGSGLGVDVDVRSRRTTRTLGDGTTSSDGRSRIYRAAVAWQGREAPWRLALGRQFSPTLAAVSVFDGLTAEYVGRRAGAGLFSGTQPDAEDYGYSSEIREHGVYVTFFGAPESARRWQLTSGLIGSYQSSEINREFLYLQGQYTGPKLSAYATQEVDLNRGWKRDAGESSVDPTSTYLSLNWRAAASTRLTAGYDNRRNVRLYRDFVNPVTQFDDTFRRGVWAGASFTIRERFRLGLDGRTSGGGTNGNADSYNLTAGVERLTRANVGVRARSTRYTSDFAEGWLHALSAGVDLGSRVRLELGGGVRNETDPRFPAGGDRSIDWMSLDLDATLGRHWYLSLSADRTDGDLETVDQIYLTTSYRF